MLVQIKREKQRKRTPKYTSVDSPFSNGLNERLNQTLINKIRCAINENQKKRAWTTIAKQCVQKYNETEHTVTGFAPKYLLDGTDTTTLPIELKQNVTKHHWIQDRETALKNTIKSHEYNKILFNEDRLHYEFEVGDMVYVGNNTACSTSIIEECNYSSREY
ncbi:hypothetical protein ALC57_10508 [Trachymyrmex cornetzi]|uniref:Integrase catalytic domain-containing protein n=1 Tax=Trachymyrmex cornetzi TaxID=471704 RepID=A0A151J449_9HYME|nr:hypothetical protein ALC57_10508 [Trachymyrmex cornetzi]